MRDRRRTERRGVVNCHNFFLFNLVINSDQCVTNKNIINLVINLVTILILILFNSIIYDDPNNCLYIMGLSRRLMISKFGRVLLGVTSMVFRG